MKYLIAILVWEITKYAYKHSYFKMFVDDFVSLIKEALKGRDE